MRGHNQRYLAYVYQNHNVKVWLKWPSPECRIGSRIWIWGKAINLQIFYYNNYNKSKFKVLFCSSLAHINVWCFEISVTATVVPTWYFFMTNLFTLSVESWSSLVKEQNFRIPDECSCNGYTLLLTTTQLCSLITNVCFVFLSQAITISLSTTANMLQLVYN